MALVRGRRLSLERLETRQVLASQIAAAVADALPRFESIDELKQFLIDQSTQQYADQFGQSYTYPELLLHDLVLRNATPQVAYTSAQADASLAGSSDYSPTNTQVQGVDEADIVETDGQYLYQLRNQGLTIVAAEPADSLAVMSVTDLPGSPDGEFLIGNRLTVITSEGHWWGVDPMFDRVARGGLPYAPYMSYRPSVTVSVFDVSDPTAPALVERTRMDGSYRDARAIDDKVFVILSNYDLRLPSPQVTCTTQVSDVGPTPVEPAAGSEGVLGGGLQTLIWDPNLPPPSNSRQCTYETKDAYLARLEPQLDAIIDGLLPHFTTWAGDESFVRGGILHEPADVVRPVVVAPQQLLSVVSFDPRDSQSGPLSAEGIPVGPSAAVFGSLDHLYVFQHEWSSIANTSSTDILQFDWDSVSGAIHASASGKVPGQILNQFSADEYGGVLRVATTESRWDPNAGTQTSNGVYLLQQDGTALDVIGSVTGLAPGEMIRSVRFLGDYGYVVTFRQIDPLFTLDLHDPTQPQVVGELKIPGYSGYLQQLDATHLLGIGRVTDVQFHSYIQVSLFDISDIRQPLRVGEYQFPANIWWSAAETNAHAVGWYPEWQLLAIPIEGSIAPSDPTIPLESSFLGGPNYQPTTALAILHVETQPTASPQPAIRLLTEIPQQVAIASGSIRSLRIGGTLYALSDGQVDSVAGANPTVILDTLTLPPPQGLDPMGYWSPPPVADNGSLPLRRWLDTSPPGDPNATATPWDDERLTALLHAAADVLAGRSDVTPDQLRLVTAEAATWIRDGQTVSGYQLVFGVGSKYFLMRAEDQADSAQPIELLDDNYQFSQDPVAGDWHNSDRPCDADGDGQVSPLDGLLIINELNLHGPKLLRNERPLRSIDPAALHDSATSPGLRRFLDSSGDDFLSPIDALLVINWLNAQSAAVGEPAPVAEGEGELLLVGGPSPAPVTDFELAPKLIDAAIQQSAADMPAWTSAIRCNSSDRTDDSLLLAANTVTIGDSAWI